MGLTDALLRFAAARPHALVADVAGGTGVRLAVEREMRRRGWPAATAPADADLLVVTGSAGPRLQPLIDRVWQQVPGPRALLHIVDPSSVVSALDDASATLAAGGGSFATDSSQPQDTAHRAHGGHQVPSGHGGMMMPGGLPMADRGEDRDGLMLDQLHVPLGPILPDWPAGLVVHTILQGDVVQSAHVETLREDGLPEDFWGGPWRRAAGGEPVTVGEATRWRAARHLDSLARLLAVAGWSDATTRVRWLRDDLLGGVGVDHVMPRTRRLAGRLRGSRTLRWLTDGVGVLPTGGDVSARWLSWLAEVENGLPDVNLTRSLSGGSSITRGLAEEPSDAVCAVLPGLLRGVDLAAARLIVASLDSDLAAAGATGG